MDFGNPGEEGPKLDGSAKEAGPPADLVELLTEYHGLEQRPAQPDGGTPFIGPGDEVCRSIVVWQPSSNSLIGVQGGERLGLGKRGKDTPHADAIIALRHATFEDGGPSPDLLALMAEQDIWPQYELIDGEQAYCRYSPAAPDDKSHKVHTKLTRIDGGFRIIEAGPLTRIRNAGEAISDEAMRIALDGMPEPNDEQWLQAQRMDEALTEAEQAEAVAAKEEEAADRRVGLQSAPQQEPFQAEWFPAGPARDFIVAWAKAVQQDLSWIALPVLSALSAMIAGVFRLLVKPGWLEPPMFWSSLIGHSGTNKTQPLEAVFAPLGEINEQLIEEWMQEDRAYQEAKSLRDARLKASAKNREALDDDTPLTEPKLTRLVLTDLTMEAAAPILSDSPRGVAYVADELSGVWAGCNRYSRGSGDEARLLSLHSGVTFAVERKTGRRTIVCRRPGLVIAGGTQPLTFLQDFSEARKAKGLLARFGLTYPSRRVKTWQSEGVPSTVTAGWRWIVRQMHGLPFDPASGPLVLTLEPDAAAAYIEWYEDHNAQAATASGHLASSLAKIEAFPLRFAQSLHVLKAVQEGRPVPAAISGETMRQAIRIAAWQRRETWRIFILMESGRFLSPADEEDDAGRWLPAILAMAQGELINVRRIQTYGPYSLRMKSAPLRSLMEKCLSGKGGWVDQGRHDWKLDRCTAAAAAAVEPQNSAPTQVQQVQQVQQHESRPASAPSSAPPPAASSEVQQCSSRSSAAGRESPSEPAPQPEPPTAAPVRTLSPAERQALKDAARAATQAAIDAASAAPPSPKPPKPAPSVPRGFGFTQEGGAS